MKTQRGSSTRLRRLFWPFDHDTVAWCRLGMKPNRSPRRFSTPLALTGGCANLRQNRRHDPTDLPRRDGVPPSFPGAIAGLAQVACQEQLVHHATHHQAPAFKLLWGPYMGLFPEQILFQVAVAMLMRKAPPITAAHFCQGNAYLRLIEADEPTFTRIAFGVFGSFTLYPEHANWYVTRLSEMQSTPAAHGHQMPLLILAHPDGFGSTHRLRTCGLKERTIQREPPFRTGPHRRPPEAAFFPGLSKHQH